MNRRLFLKLLVGLPVLGAFGLFTAPTLRYLRPTLGSLKDTKLDTEGKAPTDWKGAGGLFATPDQPERVRLVKFNLSDFPAPWSYQTFTFGQKSREYTASSYQLTNIPGYVVRLPEDKNGKPDFIVLSRICPHMGCVFNFLEDPHEAAQYNYPQAKNPLFACPCHLSVFDPLQQQKNATGKEVRGKVVSGPAPTPPRQFTWEIVGGEILIQQAESGGIA